MRKILTKLLILEKLEDGEVIEIKPQESKVAFIKDNQLALRKVRFPETVCCNLTQTSKPVDKQGNKQYK
jgi:hypothetical protein